MGPILPWASMATGVRIIWLWRRLPIMSSPEIGGVFLRLFVRLSLFRSWSCRERSALAVKFVIQSRDNGGSWLVGRGGVTLVIVMS